MREIKFRAWFPSECFQDKQARMFDKACISESGKVMHLEGGWDYSGDEEKAIPMQYTGLKDRNDKEIYEGDIVRFYEPDAQWIYEVIYVPTKACYSLSSPNRFIDIMAFQFESKLTDLYSDKVEVIGNKFENPDLLK